MKKRDATSDVFRAVVFAGAMLGCSGGSKPPATETMPDPGLGSSEQKGTDPTGALIVDAAPMAPTGAEPVAVVPDAAPPDAAPVVAPRPRPSGGKPQGRGFLLV